MFESDMNELKHILPTALFNMLFLLPEVAATDKQIRLKQIKTWSRDNPGPNYTQRSKSARSSSESTQSQYTSLLCLIQQSYTLKNMKSHAVGIHRVLIGVAGFLLVLVQIMHQYKLNFSHKSETCTFQVHQVTFYSSNPCKTDNS